MIGALLWTLAAQALAPAELDIYPEARGNPADVQRFQVRHADCVHWLGEEPYDADRAREIAAAVVQTCAGLNRERARLRRRYRASPRIMGLLRGYGMIAQ